MRDFLIEAVPGVSAGLAWLALIYGWIKFFPSLHSDIAGGIFFILSLVAVLILDVWMSDLLKKLGSSNGKTETE